MNDQNSAKYKCVLCDGHRKIMGQIVENGERDTEKWLGRWSLVDEIGWGRMEWLEWLNEECMTDQLVSWMFRDWCLYINVWLDSSVWQIKKKLAHHSVMRAAGHIQIHANFSFQLFSVGLFSSNSQQHQSI